MKGWLKISVKVLILCWLLVVIEVGLYIRFCCFFIFVSLVLKEVLLLIFIWRICLIGKWLFFLVSVRVLGLMDFIIFVNLGR